MEDTYGTPLFFHIVMAASFEEDQSSCGVFNEGSDQDEVNPLVLWVRVARAPP